MTWTIRLVNVASASMAMARKEARKSIFARSHRWGCEAPVGCGEEVRPRGRPRAPRLPRAPRGPQPRPGRHAPLWAPATRPRRRLPFPAPWAEHAATSA